MTGMLGDNPIGRGKRITPKENAAAEKAIKAYEAARDLMTVKPAKTVANVDDLVDDAVDGKNAILGATDGTAMAGGDATYTNAGVSVGFGAFKFNVAYATMDGGAYTTMKANRPITEAEANAIDGFTWSNGKVIEADYTWDHDSDKSTDKVAEAAGADAKGNSYNDPANDSWAAQRVVKDGSKDFDVWGVSVTYTDGPMAVSVGHMVHQDDAGGERTASMFSGSYDLAPGIAWKASVFGVEDTTSHKNVTGGLNEGTGFVTGIALSF